MFRLAVSARIAIPVKSVLTSGLQHAAMSTGVLGLHQRTVPTQQIRQSFTLQAPTIRCKVAMCVFVQCVQLLLHYFD